MMFATLQMRKYAYDRVYGPETILVGKAVRHVTREVQSHRKHCPPGESCGRELFEPEGCKLLRDPPGANSVKMITATEYDPSIILAETKHFSDMSETLYIRVARHQSCAALSLGPTLVVTWAWAHEVTAKLEVLKDYESLTSRGRYSTPNKRKRGSTLREQRRTQTRFLCIQNHSSRRIITCNTNFVERTA